MQDRRVQASIVMPALNEEKYIGASLEGLTRQTFKDFEIIVVDGASADRTRSIAGKYARVLIEKRKGMARARNKGAKAANGDILIFLDADTKPTRSLVSTYLDAFDDEKVIAATGPILPLEKTNIRILWGYKFVSILFVKVSIFLGVPSLVGSNFAVRKSAFDKVHGFNGNLMTYEDWDLSIRLRKLGEIKYLDKAVVYTSARRVKEWGVFGYFKYHIENMFLYNVMKKPKTNYAPIR